MTMEIRRKKTNSNVKSALLTSFSIWVRDVNMDEERSMQKLQTTENLRGTENVTRRDRILN